MKYIIFLSIIFSVGYVDGMQDKSIFVENNSNRILSIVYKDFACCVAEKLQPYQCLSLVSPTSFLVIAYQNEQYKFLIKNIRNHFVIESKRGDNSHGLVISAYNDRNIIKSKKDYLDEKRGIFPGIFEFK